MSSTQVETQAQTGTQANHAQSALWNARAGKTWVARQRILDRLFLPFEQLLTEMILDSGASDILDIGCGAGATTIAVAQSLGPHGRCTGIDISMPLIEAARARASAADVTSALFMADDAQTHRFAPGAFDAVMSRFGVMFFDAPEAAFANLRRAVCKDADLIFIAWRTPAENPFMIAAEQAAAPWLPQLAAIDPAAPGQFAFADAARIRRILAENWHDIVITSIDVPCTLSEDDLRSYALSMGRIGMLLPELDEERRAIVSDAVIDGFKRYVSAGSARFDAACWLVHARAA